LVLDNGSLNNIGAAVLEAGGASIARESYLAEHLIDAQPNAKAAWELNTYAKAEIGRILNLRVRLMAANQQREAAHSQHLVADRLAERDFMQMGVSE